MLERVRPAGSWGYKLDADSVVFGPKDTWGHNGAELPYYGSGGSTGTEAPANVGGGGDEGNIPDGFNHRKLQAYTYSDGYMNYGSSYDPSTYNTGGGTLGARAYNKHGDVIPHSARGMHADYKAHEVVEMGKWYEIAVPSRYVYRKVPIMVQSSYIVKMLTTPCTNARPRREQQEPLLLP